MPRRNRVPLVIGGLVLLCVVLALATVFGDQLMTKVVKPGQFVIQVNAQKLAAGEAVSITWGTRDSKNKIQAPSKINQGAYPSEKIELVVKDKKGKEKVYAVKARTPNDGKETITIPTGVSSGSTGYFRLTAIDNRGKLAAVSSSSSTVSVSTAVAKKESEGGSGGGGSGGSGSGGNSDSSNSSPSTVSVTLQSVCESPYSQGKFVVRVRWLPLSTIIHYRLAGESQWRYPSDYYNDPNGAYREAFVFTDNAVPPDTNFEIRFLARVDYPNGGLNAQPSQIYQFNSGPASSAPNIGDTCDFRRLY